MPGWVTDVVPHTTILSVWGNGIRDRVVHQFTNKADRDAAAVVEVDGMLCVTLDTGNVWQWWAGLGRWVPFSTRYKSWSPVTLSASGPTGGGNPAVIASAAAQYRYVSPQLVEVQCEASMGGPMSTTGVFYCSLPVGLATAAAMTGGSIIGSGYVVNYRTGLPYAAVVRQDANLPRAYFGMAGIGPNREMLNASMGSVQLWESLQWGVNFRASYQADAGPSDF